MIKKIVLAIVLLILFVNCIVIPIDADDNKPDLEIIDVDAPSTFIEGKSIELVIRIKNSGDKNIASGQNIKVGLFLDYDDAPVATNISSDGLSKGKITYINLSWTPDIGDNKEHYLSVVVNYDYAISESNLNNNEWDFFATLSEKTTSLKVLNINTPDIFEIGKTSVIYSKIINYGKETDENITVKLTSNLEGSIGTLVYSKNISRNESVILSFNWTPEELGIQDITIKVVYKNKTADSLSKTVAVGIQKFEWWNENWHYRQLITTTKKGIVNSHVNFTSSLEDIGVFDQNLENDEIRIVRYSSDGKIVEIINEFWFNESESFDSVNNAIGTLIWNTSDITGLKYYFVYFDVKANPGTRPVSAENEDLEIIGNNKISQTDIVNGWWISVLKPDDETYSLVGSDIDLQVNTTALANNVSAFIFLDENMSHNFTVYLTDIGSKLDWYGTFSFNFEGNWTIRLIGNDTAGYETLIVERTFYVGQPDLEIKDIKFSSNLDSDRIYVNDSINISAFVYCHDAPVENVSVYMNIDNSDDISVYNKTAQFNFTKGKSNIVSYYWITNTSGEYNVSFIVDYGDIINESNESNNKMYKILKVNKWPDLKVDNVTFANKSYFEFDKVKIEATISNIGAGDAVDYEVVLYIEPESNDFMKYETERDRKIITVKAKSSKKISLVWNNSIAGRWLVGVKINVNESRKDAHLSNNRLLCNKVLIVSSYDKIKPIIHNISVEPSYIEQGEFVTITANVTDDSGINKVNITIKTPSGLNQTNSMSRQTGTNNIFKYTYSNTISIGKYVFEIIAFDISIHKNTVNKTGSFNVSKETKPPLIYYFGASPIVQLKNKELDIICIAFDNIEIESVKVIISPPSGNQTYEKNLIEDAENNYVYTDSYETYGVYKYYIVVTDTAGNSKTSEEKLFWISSDIKDRDNDGMPDQWEKRYALDPNNPSDCDEDLDGDGLTNLEEYEANSDPSQEIFLHNVGYRIKNNLGYLGVAIILFIVIIFLCLYGKRRFYL